MAWQFGNPVRLVFGSGSLEQLPELAPWKCILVVTTPGAVVRGSINRVLDLLWDREVTVYDGVSPGPQIDALEEASVRFREHQFQGIVAFGGGSAIDTAKALSYLLNAPAKSLKNHFLDGNPLEEVPLTPIVAVQTAAGTGAEVTPFATIWDPLEERKYSLGPPDIYPVTALLDPELTLTLPRALTLSAGLDAICQGLESLWSKNANPVAASYAARSVSMSLDILPGLLDDLDNLELRTHMLEASLLAGLAIASTKTTLAHSISYPLTLRFGVLHGLACGFSITQVLLFNAETDEDRLRSIARSLGFASVDSLAERLQTILKDTGALGWLATLIPSRTDLLTLASRAMTPGRADNNPRIAQLEDIESIMEAAWIQCMESERLPANKG